jgi:hypothetical protein
VTLGALVFSLVAFEFCDGIANFGRFVLVGFLTRFDPTTLSVSTGKDVAVLSAHEEETWVVVISK